jgi:hypothetical protein
MTDRPPDDAVKPETPPGQRPEAEPGRPTGPTDEDGLRPGVAHERAPTEAPEERGEQPATEHAPGGDL